MFICNYIPTHFPFASMNSETKTYSGSFVVNQCTRKYLECSVKQFKTHLQHKHRVKIADLNTYVNFLKNDCELNYINIEEIYEMMQESDLKPISKWLNISCVQFVDIEHAGLGSYPEILEIGNLII